MCDLNCKVLICFLDRYNGPEIFAYDNLKPEKLIFIHENTPFLLNKFNDVRAYINERNPAIVENCIIESIEDTALRQIITKYPREGTIISLSGGDKLYGLLALRICKEEGCQAVFADLDEKRILDFSQEGCDAIKLSYIEPEVEDFIGSTGGDIQTELSTLLDDPGVERILDCIAKNRNLWGELRRILTGYISKRCSENEYEINLSYIKDAGRFSCFLQSAVDSNLITVISKSEDLLRYRNNTKAYRNLLDENGWIRTLVYHEMKKMKEVDDIKFNVKFAWDQDDPRVIDVADILASAGGRLIYVLFRNRFNNPTWLLNDIAISSEQIGGNEVIRILVLQGCQNIDPGASKRAEAMGVQLIKFNNDLLKLKYELSNIIRDA